ncbi:Gfo/Idh/MocA family oxidoreductase [Arthrobacter sp. efr-133-TYG-118]|uniref:Gfo/Idh/MocA family protein n=1 Tax=Arthrobacter sp. efr-133-TYG-118 TaxID=3040279 RepID=UPI00255106C1|nr:Gfo/Idh/MocA family oxidoreductase [Arthrobacter sp. efr-133-TYG-118]
MTTESQPDQDPSLTADECAADPIVRWGIVATGTISRQMTADLRLVEGADVAAVSSRDLQKADAFADEFEIPQRYGDYRELLDAEIDAVYIGSPHVTHFEIAKAALLAGKHVLCEKPMGLSAAEVRELGALAARQRLFLMEAMWMKFNPLHIRLLELLRSGRIGEVRSVDASFGIPFQKDDSSRWKAEMRGSTLLDQGIYPVTLAHMVFGIPEAIQAAGVVRDDGVDLSEHFTLSYSDGRYARGASSMVEFLDLGASICGTKGWISTEPGFWATSKMTVHTPFSPDSEPNEPIETLWEGNGYVPMLRAVNESIVRGELENTTHTNEDAAAVFDSLDEIRRQLS